MDRIASLIHPPENLAKLGTLLLLLNGDGELVRLDFLDGEVRELKGALAAKGLDAVADPLFTREAEQQLHAYFRRELRHFDLALSLGGTAFQLSVWRELQRLPYGETVSYGDVAARLGKKEAVRAVGGAVGANPVSIVVPCHRVIGADGSLVGYGSGLPRKRALLLHEGAIDPSLF